MGENRRDTKAEEEHSGCLAKYLFHYFFPHVCTVVGEDAYRAGARFRIRKKRRRGLADGPFRALAPADSS